MTLRYLSLFSGIEAATVAWKPLGWHCVGVAEIEPFPSKVLAHHYPDVPNLGDVTKVTEDDIASLGHIDIVVFGSPCQDLSVAGKRKGLEGARSGLFFTALDIVRWARDWCGCRFALWENVPGAFSSNKGRDFAAVVDALSGLEDTGVPPKGWGTEGCAVGPEAMVEWATLDAQWFGVAQRRRRMFALADFGDWAGRPPILLEPDSLRGDSAPRREAGERVANALTDRADRGGTNSEGQRLVVEQRPVLTSNGVVPHRLNAGGMGRIDYETKTMVVCVTGDVSHALCGEGFNASEDRTGRGTPLVPVAVGTDTYNGSITGDVAATLGTQSGDSLSSGPSVMVPLAFVSTQITSEANYSNPNVVAFHHNAQAAQLPTAARDTSVADALTCSQGAAVAYAIQAGALRTNPNSGPDGMGVQSDLAYTLEARAEVQAVVTYECGGIGRYDASEVSSPLLRTGADKGPGCEALVQVHGYAVRRLTPLECERLQGFPDTYTAIPKAADGPRYKALGNSMAVPVMHWIGRQIDFAWRFF